MFGAFDQDMVPEHFPEKGVRTEVTIKDLLRVDGEVDRKAVGLSDSLDLLYPASSGNEKVEVGLLVRGPLCTAPEDCTASLDKGDDPAENSRDEGFLLPETDPPVDLCKGAEVPCVIAPPQGEQPRPASGGGAEDLLCLKVFEGRLGRSTADRKAPGDLPDVHLAVVAPNEEGEDPKMVLPDVQDFRHMSRILDGPRHHGSDRRVIARVKGLLRGPGSRPGAAVFGSESIWETRCVAACHRNGL